MKKTILITSFICIGFAILLTFLGFLLGGFSNFNYWFS